MNIVLNALTVFTSCNFSVRLQEAVGRSHATELAKPVPRLGNLRQQSDELRNKQPSPPFVQSSHPQLAQTSIVERASISAAGRDSRRNAARHRPR